MYENLIPIAKAIALEIPRKYKHVSVILKGKRRIISIGTNIFKSHPEAIRRGYIFPELHSEIRAFLKVPYTQRDKLTLVNFRFNRRGEMCMSKPCYRCLPFSLEVFKDIYYSTNDGIVKL